MISLKEIDSTKLSSEITDFVPIECINCEFDGNIPIKYFLVSRQDKPGEGGRNLKPFNRFQQVEVLSDQSSSAQVSSEFCWVAWVTSALKRRQ